MVDGAEVARGRRERGRRRRRNRPRERDELVEAVVDAGVQVAGVGRYFEEA